MASTFFGLSVATTGLSAQRRAMDIIGYNVAHANDPTYKRQRIVMTETGILAQSQESSVLGTSPFGTGVATGDVMRIRDALIENRMRTATQACANWEYRSQTMRQLESTIGEPSDTGLQTDLDNFWNSWSKVSTSPQDLPIRSALLEDTDALCQRVQYEYKQMQNMVDDLNSACVDRVGQINLMGEELARLNNEIGALESGNVPVNDLENRREALVLELSKLASVNQHGSGKEDYIISLGGRVLVQGSKFNALTTQILPGGSRQVQWADDNQPVTNSGGELKAIIDLRDGTIPSYLSQLDNIASTLVEKVNTLHSAGRTLSGNPAGNYFKAGTTAANLALDDSIIGHPELVAASKTGAVADGDNANDIGAVKDVIISNGLTLNQLYRALVGDIGGTAATAETQSEAHRLSLDQFTTQQQSISGVSLDEEMTNIIKFQQAYNASARMLTVMDEMLGTLIQGTGAVGR